MTATVPSRARHEMSTDEPITVLVLEEFRLRNADGVSAAACIFAASLGGIEGRVPLLTSIDDRRDVATVRALRTRETNERDPGHRVALEHLVESWQPRRAYGPRMAERSGSPPSYYRLAVTESGINNAEADPLPAISWGFSEDATSTHLGLLWIGLPLGTHAGLLMLLGSYDGPDAVRRVPHDWPLPLSRSLGVRIYESV